MTGWEAGLLSLLSVSELEDDADVEVEAGELLLNEPMALDDSAPVESEPLPKESALLAELSAGVTVDVGTTAWGAIRARLCPTSCAMFSAITAVALCVALAIAAAAASATA